MSKTRDTGFLGNVVKVDASGNVSFVSGSTTLATINTSGQLSGSSPVLSASYASNAETLDGLDSTVFTLTSSFNAQTASFTAFTASINSFSASHNTFTASILAQTASLNAFSASVLSYTSSINAKTSSFATTGSNTFIGTQTITGSVLQSGSFTTTGTIIAQTINVQQVTSSIVYSCGNNIFGSTIGNTQVFTGSVLITGSLTIAGGSSASSYSGATIYGSTAVCSPVGYFSGCVGIGQPNPQTTLEVNGGNTYFPAKIITLSGAEATRYNGFIGLNLIGGSQLGMSLGTRSNNVDYTNTLNLYQGNVGIGTNTTNPTEKLEMNVGSGTRLGMAITGEYPYIILNSSGSSSVNARSFALSLTSLEAGDFAIKMSNCKNGNPVADGFDPLRISRAGDTTITCTLTVSGCGLIMSGTGALTLPNGTTAQRPGSPSAGMIRYNNATNTTEYYNGCAWYALSDNYVHSVDMLMVSGGGGGGVNLSGAGGGGGVLYFSSFSLRPGIPINVIVGGGGAVGGQGNASCVFGNVLCGGQGASQVTFHRSGNSGFLASLANSNCYTSVSVYCNNLGGYASGNAGAGGAGAGGAGADMCSNSDVNWKAKPGACGAQVGTILDGVNNYYWAGGGGGEGYGDYAGAGGCGGGGGGGSFSAYGTQFYPGCGGLGGLNPGCPGTVTNSPLNGGAGGANTGGGGGGGSHTGASQTSATGGPGGSGIVILRYPQNYNPPIVTGTTPCICTYCGYRSYIFLSSGTITF